MLRMISSGHIDGSLDGLLSKHILRLALSLSATLVVGLLFSGAQALAAGEAPVIESLSASHITQDDATVEAQVNPEGLETTYELFMPEDPCNVPMECIRVHVVLAQGSIPATATDESISLDMASKHVSMEGGEQYGVRIIAKNSAGTVEGHYSFRTPPAPPSIESESASNVTEHDATLEATINPNGLYAGYEFQLYTIDNGEYNFIQNCPFDIPGYEWCAEYVKTPPPGLVESQPQYIPAGSGDQSVSLDLASIGATLEPGSTYHYRVLTANTHEIVQGPVQEFTTPSQPTSPPAPGTEPPSSSIAAGLVASELPGAFPAIVSANAFGLPTDKPKVLTNAQKLARVLKTCDKKPKRQRASCKRQAEKKYATTAKDTGKKAK